MLTSWDHATRVSRGSWTTQIQSQITLALNGNWLSQQGLILDLCQDSNLFPCNVSHRNRLCIVDQESFWSQILLWVIISRVTSNSTIQCLEHREQAQKATLSIILECIWDLSDRDALQSKRARQYYMEFTHVSMSIWSDLYFFRCSVFKLIKF